MTVVTTRQREIAVLTRWRRETAVLTTWQRVASAERLEGESSLGGEVDP